MKKTLALALMALILLCSVAFAEEVELPEEALEFNNVWVNGEIRIDAYPEDGGFVLEVSEWKDFEAMTGYIWEYKAVYQEEDDTLVNGICPEMAGPYCGREVHCRSCAGI